MRNKTSITSKISFKYFVVHTYISVNTPNVRISYNTVKHSLHSVISFQNQRSDRTSIPIDPSMCFFFINTYILTHTHATHCLPLPPSFFSPSLFLFFTKDEFREKMSTFMCVLFARCPLTDSNEQNRRTPAPFASIRNESEKEIKKPGHIYIIGIEQDDLRIILKTLISRCPTY